MSAIVINTFMLIILAAFLYKQNRNMGSPPAQAVMGVGTFESVEKGWEAFLFIFSFLCFEDQQCL